MELLGLDYADIQIDTDGQPIASDNGDFSVVQDTECWLQDIRNDMKIRMTRSHTVIPL